MSRDGECGQGAVRGKSGAASRGGLFSLFPGAHPKRNSDMTSITFELVVITLLLLLNGVFAMSELAVMTARRVRLEHRAERGDRGAATALALAHKPNDFLSTVQIGITLIGTLAGAFGGASLAEELAVPLARVGWIGEHAAGVALAIVVAGITYASLILGELVPKRIAIGHPEAVASFVARPMRMLARIGMPLVAVLTASTNFVFRLLGTRASSEPGVTEQDIRAMVEQGAESGVVHQREHEIVENTFRLGDRQVASLMIPRPDVPWVDVSEPSDAMRAALVREPEALWLVCDGDLDHVKGVLYAEDLAAQCLDGAALDVHSLLWEPLYVPETMQALAVAEEFRRTRQPVCIALDEFGGVRGIVTIHRLLEALVGDLPERRSDDGPEILRTADGSWDVAGGASLESFEQALDLDPIAAHDRRSFRTVGGFAMSKLARVPRKGDRFEWSQIGFEVVSMDGRRIARMRVTRLDP